MRHVPINERHNIVGYYLKQMLSYEGAIREKYAYEWAYYEFSIYKLKTKEKEIVELLEEYSYKSLSPLEAHYMLNDCFLPDNYILENASKIAHIPVSIVHGRYDFICPPKYAFQLHEKLPESRLHIVCAGHTSSEVAIKKKIQSEINRLSNFTTELAL